MLFDNYIDKILFETEVKQENFISPADIFATQAPLYPEYADTDQEYINKTYHESWVVFRCIFLIANNIAKLPKKIFRKDKGKKIEITDRPEFKIFRKPNTFQTAYDFWMESVSRLKLQGELFWLKQFGARNQIEALYADWRSEQVKIIPHPQFLIDKYRVYINNRWLDFPRDQVFYIRYFHPFTNIRGISPAKAARHDITLELNAVNFNKKYFKSGMKSPGIFETEKEINESEFRRFQQRIMSSYQGLENMYKPMILDGGLQFKPLNQNFSLKDAEFLEGRKFSVENIAGVYGVPLELITFANKTWENFDQAQKSFWEFTLIPDIQKLTDLINTFLMPELTNDSTAYFEMDLSGVEALQEKRSQKIKDYKEAFGMGAATPNMILQEVFGIDPIDNPAMNTFYLPMNVSPIAEYKQKQKQMIQKQVTADDRDRIWHLKATQTAAQERPFVENLKKFFSKQEKEVLNNFDNQFKSKKQLTVQGELFNLEKWAEEAAKLGQPFIIEAVRQAGQELLESEFDLTHPGVRNALGQRVAKFSIDINLTTRQKIREEIADGIAAGEGIQEIKERIKSVFKKAKDSRAQLIARTEIVGAHNFGIQKGMEQGGFERKMWLTSRDENVRDSHLIDGQVKNINESFILLDGRQMEYPSDFNERCFHVPTNEPKT